MLGASHFRSTKPKLPMQAVTTGWVELHGTGTRYFGQPPQIAAAQQHLRAEWSGQVVPALRPVQAAAGDAVPPRPKRGRIDPKHCRKPHGPGWGDIQPLAACRGE